MRQPPLDTGGGRPACQTRKPGPESRARIAAALGRSRAAVEKRIWRLGGALQKDAARRPEAVSTPPAACQYIGECRGGPREWTFCGAPSLPGRSYCPEHAEICYQGGKHGEKDYRAWLQRLGRLPR